MFDPASLGTLLIGLGAESDSTGRQRPRPAGVARRPAIAGIRIAVAGVLRRAADLLEPRTAREPAR